VAFQASIIPKSFIRWFPEDVHSHLIDDLDTLFSEGNEMTIFTAVKTNMISILTSDDMGIYFSVYLYCQEEAVMETAKLFANGRSQAVRLPKAYRFEGNEVYIKKVAGGVLLLSKNQSIWDLWERNLMKYKEPFMTDRNQPELQQERESLDQIYD
jgi:antitoxin VapB